MSGLQPRPDGLQPRPRLFPKLVESFNNETRIFLEAVFGHNYKQCQCSKMVMVITPQMMAQIITMKVQGDFTVSETAQLASLFANMCACPSPGGEQKRKWNAFSDWCRIQNV